MIHKAAVLSTMLGMPKVAKSRPYVGSIQNQAYPYKPTLEHHYHTKGNPRRFGVCPPARSLGSLPNLSTPSDPQYVPFDGKTTLNHLRVNASSKHYARKKGSTTHPGRTQSHPRVNSSDPLWRHAQYA